MLSTFEKVVLLKKVPFFSVLETEDLRRVSEICEEVFFDAGDVIMREGEEGRTLYIIESGRVRVLSHGKTFFLESPAHIGEIAVLAGGKRRATVDAVEHTNTVTIESEKFQELILKHPHIIFPIVKTILERAEI